MKKLCYLLLFVLALSFSLNAEASNRSFKQVTQSNNWLSFYKYLANKIKYPPGAKIENIQGNSILTFSLVKGNLKNIKINTELGYGCDVEVLNNLMAYPNFKVLKDGNYALKTAFRLDGSNSTLKNGTVQMPSGYTALKTLTITSFTPTNIAIKAKHDVKVVGDQEAITIIDGKAEKFGLTRLNPEQIASIHILKGDDAIKAYGSEAKFGAIVVSTKEAQPINGAKGVEVQSYGFGNHKVILRGNNSDQNALVVVDGKVNKYVLAALDPNDIESVQIIKDAAAVSLYGEEAKNGAVIITTKYRLKTDSTKTKPFEIKGKNGSVYLRGLPAYGSNQPIYLIDDQRAGINDIEQLDPANIESISVLKDASAITLYGNHAKAGVVIVKTKKGRTIIPSIPNNKNINENQKKAWMGLEFSGPNSPLYVLNDKVLDYPSISQITPNQIASIEVFKDLETISKYGPEAVNGVIKITTKKELAQKTKK